MAAAAAAALSAPHAGDLDSLKKLVAALDEEGKGAPAVAAAGREANKRTTLHFAAREGRTDACNFLVDQLELPVDPKDDDGETPLIHATRQGHLQIAKYLQNFHEAANASRMAASSASPQAPPSPLTASPAEERRDPHGGRPPPPPYVKAAAGSLGGVMEACCLQPIDVVKTRLQLDRAGAYRGIAHCGATVARAEGVRALWKGLTPFATHLTLKYALRLGSNAILQSAFKDPTTGKVSTHGRLASGFGAGVLEALLIVTPFEVVKIRLQQQKGLSPDLLRYKGPIHCARTIVREEGLFGLWSGALPTVMRNGTNQAAMFTAKNTFDIVLWKKHEGDGKVLQPWQSMASGFLAGTAGPICTGPFDVVKTRLMAQGRTGDIKYKGMVHAIRTIYAEEGLRALWKGLLPRLMRIPPGQAIMWAVADQVTGLYERTYRQPTHL